MASALLISHQERYKACKLLLQQSKHKVLVVFKGSKYYFKEQCTVSYVVATCCVERQQEDSDMVWHSCWDIVDMVSYLFFVWHKRLEAGGMVEAC